MKIAARSRTRAYVMAAVLVVAWSGGFLLYTVLMDSADKGDEPCFMDAFRAPDLPSGTAVELGVSPERLALRFGQSRGAQRDQAEIKAANAPPTPLQVAATALRSGRGTIDASDVHVRAQALRDTILIDVCLDLREVGDVRAGTFEGKAIFTDPRVSALSIPITATIQARYLMGLTPLIVLFPLLGLYIVWTSVSSEDQAKFGRGALTAFILALAAAAVAFGTQGYANDGWGGLLSVGALIGTMYTAATGITATLISQAQRDNPAPSGAVVQPTDGG